MTAKEKIEKLTDTWYGYTLFANGVSLVINGIGFFSIAFTAMATIFSLFVTFLIGRWLLGRSSFGRLVVLCLSGIGLVAGALAVLRFGAMFLDEWSIAALAQTIVVACGVLVNLRSLRTLTDTSVKSYFKG